MELCGLVDVPIQLDDVVIITVYCCVRCYCCLVCIIYIHTPSTTSIHHLRSKLIVTSWCSVARHVLTLLLASAAPQLAPVRLLIAAAPPGCQGAHWTLTARAPSHAPPPPSRCGLASPLPTVAEEAHYIFSISFSLFQHSFLPVSTFFSPCFNISNNKCGT